MAKAKIPSKKVEKVDLKDVKAFMLAVLDDDARRGINAAETLIINNARKELAAEVLKLIGEGK